MVGVQSTGAIQAEAEAPTLEHLSGKFGHLEGLALIKAMVESAFPQRIAVVSSFGSEAAVLLALVAEVDPAVPVIFLDTHKHFPETLAYRNALTERLGLRDVRSVSASSASLAQEDPEGRLWETGPDACCALRKVRPLATALRGFDAWITGRKRFQGGERTGLRTIESLNSRYKINPLAHWTAKQIEAAYEDYDLPRHPLFAEGYLSIGCATCTRKPVSCDLPRSGRWTGLEKTECGIHQDYWKELEDR